MERPLWDRIQEIYYSTLAVDDSERVTFVDTACDSNSILINEVTSLLEAEKSSGDFLEPPIFDLGLRLISGNADSASRATHPDVDELIGATIDGRYLVEKELGRGGMGAVYLARDLSLHNRPVVIKTLLPAALPTPLLVRKFRQEVEALSRIDHPGVVSVLSAGKLADGKLFIGMQYIKGVTLRSQISSEGMHFERAASILKEMGAALDDVHEQGIFHRDLKPENIMLQTLTGGTELVKIVDFGIAKVKDSVVAPSTMNEASIGTVLYMSPEQLLGERVTAASDIYSMALVAYEMLTGRCPFNPTSAPQLLNLQRAGVRVMPADLRPGLSTEAQAIILRGLAFKPTGRYRTAGDFGNSLARALFGETTKTYVSHSKKISKRLLVVTASLLLVLCAAAVTGVYILRGRQQAAVSVSPPQRSFSYWLTVQKVRDGRNYQDPFESLDDEIFESGYKFRINVAGPGRGYLYVINERPDRADGATFRILYPTPSKPNAIVSSQRVHTNWNRFPGRTGTENIWIVWSTTLVSELEHAKTESFENEKGELTNANSIRAVREFLTKNAEPKPESTRDKTAQMTHVRGPGEVLVKLAQLEHR